MMSRPLLCLIFFLPGWLSGQQEREGDFEVRYEVFSLPLGVAAKLNRERLAGPKLYERVLNLIGSEARQERWICVRARTGVTARVQEVESYPYLTEFEYDKFSPHPVFNGDLDNLPKVPLLPLPSWWAPLTFDVKMMGNELECLLERKGELVFLYLSVSQVDLGGIDRLGEGVAEVRYPRFLVRRLQTKVELKLGTPTMIGAISPPKPKLAGEDKRVWWAFVTVEKF